MGKRKIIIITIISTIISLAIIFLSYFGIFRYYLMRYKSSESYISNYKMINKTDTKTIIAISTTPKRIKKIRPMINSILDQTIRVDNIILIVPQDDIDTGYTIPSDIKKIASLFPKGKDYGTGFSNSIIPMILTQKECNTTIITLLDNIIYGKDFLETIIIEGEKHKERVIYDKNHTSILFKPEYYDSSIINDKSKYTDECFLKNAKLLDYTENYKF
jgi:hypothetical protein